MTFDTFQEQWRQFLVAKQLQEHQGVHFPRFELKQEGKMPTDELQQELQSNTARLHARLGTAYGRTAVPPLPRQSTARPGTGSLFAVPASTSSRAS
jgi:hypothetical protein